MRTERESKTHVNSMALKRQRVPAGVSALFLILIAASIAAFAAACSDDPSPTPEPVATAAPTAAPVPTAAPTATPMPIANSDDALTRAYVEKAIEFYAENGLEETVAYYRTLASSENGRSLILVDKAESTLLVYPNVPPLQGQYVGPGSPFSAFAGNNGSCH